MDGSNSGLDQAGLSDGCRANGASVRGGPGNRRPEVKLEMGFAMSWERWLELVDHPMAMAVFLLLIYVALWGLRHRLEDSGHQSPRPVRSER
jgi:hypothetical protein